MHKAAAMCSASGTAPIRCAIYTRKSSEEGLEQAFNSLDAQREACEAFILSQKHEGWIVQPAMYDDGGISGGTLQRPALTRLLADIEADKVDAVVVYKVDRLTRSLADFAKIVDVFDRAGASFVSVTQQFNTTTSMGRLTLNMLLSFAQFEREVTGERIRDKIAASKQKGMWMGGLPPLGYDVQDRKLVVNETEAKTVRHIFARFLALGSVRTLKEELDRDGIVSKYRVDRFDRRTGSKPLARGALYRMLQNRHYRGEITHKDKSYPGEHSAIIDEVLWDQVQALLLANRVVRKTGARSQTPSLLAGLIHDETGSRMTPTHATKKGRRYRYYVSQTLICGGGTKGSSPGRRIPAGDVEALVEDRITGLLGDAGAIINAIERNVLDVTARQRVVENACDLARRWSDLHGTEKRLILQWLVSRIDVQRHSIEIAIFPAAIAIVADADFDASQPNPGYEDDRPIVLSIPAQLKRVGIETKLLIDGANRASYREPDRSMLRLLAQAHRYRNMLLAAQGKTMSDLADEAGVGRSYFCRVVRLGFLAPDVTRAILHGRYPPELTAKGLSLRTALPNAWADQKHLLGTA